MTFARCSQRPAIPDVLRGGRVGRIVLLCPVLLWVVAWPARAATYYQRGGATARLDADTQHIAIEFDPSLGSSMQLMADMAARGFKHLQPITYACSARKLTFAVPVPGITAETMDALRAVPGVRAARRLYRFEGIDSALVQTGQIALKPRSGTTEAQVYELAAQADCEVVRSMGIGITMYVLRIKDESSRDAVETAEILARSSLVDFAQPDFHSKRNRHQIDDPLFGFQWHLENRGQTGGSPGSDVKAAVTEPRSDGTYEIVGGAWQVTEGQGATVAILDDAVDWQHPDIIDSVVARYDFVNDDDDPSPFRLNILMCMDNCDDDDPANWLFCEYCNLYPQDEICSTPHGTSTAGLAVARANTIGVRGVAPQANLIAEAMLFTSDIGIADAFYFAEFNGADVISNSWGPGSPGMPTPEVIQAAIEDVSRNGRGGRGVLVMFSSGNESSPIRKWGTFAALPDVMAIGATLKDDRLTCYSNFGAEQSVVAPGGGLKFGQNPTYQQCFEFDMATTDVAQVPVELLEFFFLRCPEGSTCPPDPLVQVPALIWASCPDPPAFLTGYNPPAPPSVGPILDDFGDVNYTRRFNGTSAACPVAAGCAALVAGIDPGLSSRQIRNILEHTADKIHPGDGGYDPVTGRSEIFGHGRINADRAVRSAAEGRVWPSPVTNVVHDSIFNRVYFRWTNPPEDVLTVLIVRSAGTINFSPVDGVEYAVGETVAPDTVVVENALTETYVDNDAPEGELNYALFVRSPINHYSWGVRVKHASPVVGDVPLAAATAQPSAGPAPLKVLFSGGGIDPLGRRIVEFAWIFGDGTTGSGASVEHTYAAEGTYTASLRVRNSAGVWTPADQAATVKVEVGAPFTVGLVASPRTGAAPLTVKLTATTTGSTTAITSHRWDFGDGSAATTTGGQVFTTSHTYANPGTYTASVTVTNRAGASVTATTMIAVTSSAGSQSTREVDSTTVPAFCGSGTATASLFAALVLMLARTGRAIRTLRRSR